ncbi:MAG: hypothetical protein DCC58_18710 [Chloroflexi bacterium]|nr:MAG: hypothetical protein DCC58_18710 [Chloroflexota bacterium]
MTERLRVGEVAQRSGVSIRTLHHDDRLGLVRPHGYSEGGHRLYAPEDMLRLQQVLLLRYLGFPLRRIRDLLEQPNLDLAASLRDQQRLLAQRIREQERIATALEALLAGWAGTGHWHWDRLFDATGAVQASLNAQGRSMNEMHPRFTEEQQREFAALAGEVGEAELRAIERDWAALIADVRANRERDPSDPLAQELAARWDALLERTFRGHNPLMDVVGRQYAAGAFAGNPDLPQAEDFAFIEAARKAAAAG